MTNTYPEPTAHSLSAFLNNSPHFLFTHLVLPFQCQLQEGDAGARGGQLKFKHRLVVENSFDA